MPKNKVPALADWLVSFTGPIPVRAVRATALHIRDGAIILSDSYGHPLFAAPLGAVCCVRRLEPGEKAAPAPSPAPAPPRPAPVADLMSHAPSAAPEPAAAEKAVPAPRPRGRRK